MRQLNSHQVMIPVLAGLMLALCFAGCAGSTSGQTNLPSGSSPTATPPNAHPTKPPLVNLNDYCNLVSLAEVSQVTSLTITRVTPIVVTSRGEVICGYEAGTGSSAGAVILFLVSADAGQAQSTFAALKQQAQTKGATVASLSGVGDDAFTTLQKGVASVGVLKGTVVFLTSGTTGAPLPLTVDKPLAQLVASRL